VRRRDILALLIDALYGDTLLCRSQTGEAAASVGSHPEQVGIEFGVSVFLRPKTERDGGKFVDDGIGETVLGEVYRFDVGVASIATLDPNVSKGFRGVNRKLGMVFLAATGTYDAAELPFGEAEATEQVAAGAIAQLAEHA